jgi:hypothetical protein
MPFNTRDGTGIALNALFEGWPPDRIAQICGVGALAMADRSLCRSYFGLGAAELVRAPVLRLFDLLRGMQMAGGGAGGAAPSVGAGARQTGFKAWLRRYLHERGWLYPVDARLSPGLKKFLDDFAPDLIFAAPAEFALTRLTRQIADYLDRPVAVQVWDNWMALQYRKGWGAAGKRHRLDDELGALFGEAALRFGICETMCEAYAAAYGRPFLPLPVSVDVAAWQRPLAARGARGTPHTILYAGTLHRHAAYAGLADMSRAVEALNVEGLAVRLRILGAVRPSAEQRADLGGRFTEFAEVTDREALIAEVGTADLLFLPVAFDAESRDFIKYSFPAKSAAYMASGTPMLIYAPAELPISREATRHGIAHAVTERDTGKLAAGARHMLCDAAARAEISDRAVRRAQECYDRTMLRERARQMFCDAVSAHAAERAR